MIKTIKTLIIRNIMATKNKLKKRVMNHLGHVGLAAFSFALMSTSVNASEPVELASEVMGNEGAKQALNTALKIAKSKPAMTTATGTVCLACIPVAGAAANLGMCIACGILIAKTFG